MNIIGSIVIAGALAVGGDPATIADIIGVSVGLATWALASIIADLVSANFA